MIAFRVDDMSCGHCAGVITQAVQAVDAGARVTVDLTRHRVEIEPASGDGAGLREAIAEAGYTPVPIDAGAPAGS